MMITPSSTAPANCLAGGATGSREIYFYDGAIHQITSNSYDDVGARLNNNGDIAYWGMTAVIGKSIYTPAALFHQLTNNNNNESRAAP